MRGLVGARQFRKFRMPPTSAQYTGILHKGGKAEKFSSLNFPQLPAKDDVLKCQNNDPNRCNYADRRHVNAEKTSHRFSPLLV